MVYKFKVGDRVVYEDKDGYDEGLKGTLATIVYVDTSDTEVPYFLEADKNINRCNGGHAGTPGVREGHGKWACEEDLKLAVDTPKPASASLKNVGADAPTTTNEHGGKQSVCEYAFTQIDPGVMFEEAEILQGGAKKYGRDNWKKITVEEHLNHALQHIYAYLLGNKEDAHLGHARTRLGFAMVIDRDGLDV